MMAAPSPPDFDPDQLIAFMVSHGHNGQLGVQPGAYGDDWAELALPYDERFIGDPATGIIASGPILAMMDMAVSLGIWLKAGQFRPQATLDLRVDYLRPAKPGRTIVGRGECYRITRSVAFVRGQAHDGDPANPIAHVAGTYMFTDTPA